MKFDQTEHIPAGSFKAQKSSSVIFQAYLGTCVGVALYDYFRKTGGLIHILLPEPPFNPNPDLPEKYASEGLPMLIEEMVRLGASPENMKATIAGGALVGPLTDFDLNLDIGGRSVEIVNAILAERGIQVIKSETGGFFTCTLELDLTDGATAITPSYLKRTEPGDIKEPSINDIKETIEQLHPIPQIALKLLRMWNSQNYNAAGISHELSKDQVLSAKTLQICNSVLFSGTSRIDTLKDAVLILGEGIILKSVITAAVRSYFSLNSESAYSLCKGGLFFHAVSTAVTAEKIAEVTEAEEPKRAYTAGLLHDIGKVVLDQYLSKGHPLFFRDMGLTDDSLIETEKKYFGLSHCSTGVHLARDWHLSEYIEETIKYHHTPDKARKNKRLVSIVYIADLLVSRFNTGLETEKIDTGQLKPALEILGLSLSRLPDIVDFIPVNIFSEETLMQS